MRQHIKAKNLEIGEFDAIRLTLASPDQVRQWSWGEVKKPETINYRTFKPERDGLFCERTFGPVRDYECNCGKYKWVKYRGKVCERCGVEVTESKVRRERMGHIELAVPVLHIWYLRKSPSPLAMLLEMKLGDVESIVYYARYVVIRSKVDELPVKTILTEGEVLNCREKYGNQFEVLIGGGAIQRLLENLDLKKKEQELKAKINEFRQKDEGKERKRFQAARQRLAKQLELVQGLLLSGNRPEWMVLEAVPVIPPDLRPLVPLKEGRFASSDLNDLYRRIINRNNRLKHISNLNAPLVMINNEKRLLQEAVDALIENGARGKTVNGANNRPLKSLSDSIKGKEGRFRQNLLGKRVDYSGRSVIVCGPHLKLHQCGLPKEMALELFKPFILRELLSRQLASSERQAKRMLQEKSDVVFDVLENVIQGHPALLNRAPTLHRVSIQAFLPVLVEGKAIQLHPLVCAAFNADFDGDQMAVHIPLTAEACLEAMLLMLSVHNILSPANGSPLVAVSQDIVLGCSYLTKEKRNVFGEGKIFADEKDVLTTYEHGRLDLHARIKVRKINKIREDKKWKKEDFSNPDKWENYTTVGRVIFNQALPEQLRFVNSAVDKKELAELVERSYFELGPPAAVELVDSLKVLGYRYATKAGITVSLEDMPTPEVKKLLVEKARQQVKHVESQYHKGIITNSERYNNIVDIWMGVTKNVALKLFEELEKVEKEPAKEKGQARFNSIYLMASSGARGSKLQISQLAGMRGLMARPAKRVVGQIGEIIETPIVSNFREGLSVLEYFISAHGGRKGLADTALKTAEAGYLTRRLVDVAHNVVVIEEDCRTNNGISVRAMSVGDEVLETLVDRIIGRVSAMNIANPITDEPIIKAGELIMRKKAEQITEAGIERVKVRSVLTCESKYGVCAKCYGADLSNGRIVKVATPVGIIAAQSIGEPGTQLTLRTFHIGGAASREVQRSSLIAKQDGEVKFLNLKTIKREDGKLVVVGRNTEVSFTPHEGSGELSKIPYGARLSFANRRKVKAGELIAEWEPYSMPIITEYPGIVKYEDLKYGISLHEEINPVSGVIERVIINPERKPRLVVRDPKGHSLGVYTLPEDTRILVDNGAKVKTGDVLARIPQEVHKTKDITGGLPRIDELFEARRPKNAAVVAEKDGIVSQVTSEKGKVKLIVESMVGGDKVEYVVPHGRHPVVYSGETVLCGEPLTDGEIDPHDILRVKRSPKDAQEFIVNEIQEIYRLQGAKVNDKHIEIITSQMFGNVRVEDAGDTKFLEGMTVNLYDALKENSEIEKRNKRVAKDKKGKKKLQQATYSPVLLGISKASLASSSFISAASFQETTRVLTNAALMGKVDELHGLKENVIIGRPIPVGTGFPGYREEVER